jgi:hypothetical protein
MIVFKLVVRMVYEPSSNALRSPFKPKLDVTMGIVIGTCSSIVVISESSNCITGDTNISAYV